MMKRASVFLAILLFSLPVAAEITPPVNLGASGMTLSLRLWKWTDAAGWTAESVAGLTIADLTTGEYTVDGLPSATDSDRYSLIVAETASPAVGLAAYHYGASPGQRIVWQTVTDPSDSPLTFKQDDTHGSITLVIQSGLVSDIGDPSTTLTFSMWGVSSGAAVFTTRASVISNVALDALTGTYSALFTYDLQTGDMATPGSFLGEFKITYPDTTVLTLPSNNQLRIKVVRDFG